MTTTIDKIDFASCISELLHLQDRVVLPGLGALEGAYKAAVVDQVQGKILPPSKKVTFNPHVKLSDGALTNLVAKKYGYSLTKAQSELDDYLTRLKQSLEKREIVEIAGIGRLYLDFEGEYKFIAGPQNFHAPSYGLPELRFNPLKRQHAPVVAKARALRPANAPKQGIRLPSPSLWVLSIAGLALLISVFFIFKEILSRPGAGLDILPPLTQAPASPVIGEEEEEDPAQDEDYAFVKGALGELVDTEAPTRAPGVREAVVILGAFKDEANAAKKIQELFSDGYEAYSDQKDGATRVGIRFPFSNDAELQEQVKTIQDRYNKKAWVFFPED